MEWRGGGAVQSSGATLRHATRPTRAGHAPLPRSAALGCPEPGNKSSRKKKPERSTERTQSSCAAAGQAGAAIGSDRRRGESGAAERAEAAAARGAWEVGSPPGAALGPLPTQPGARRARVCLCVCVAARGSMLSSEGRSVRSGAEEKGGGGVLVAVSERARGRKVHAEAGVTQGNLARPVSPSIFFLPSLFVRPFLRPPGSLYCARVCSFLLPRPSPHSRSLWRARRLV